MTTASDSRSAWPPEPCWRPCTSRCALAAAASRRTWARAGRRRGRLREQIDAAVELPQRVRHVAGRGADLEEAVDLLRSVAVGDVAPVRRDVELVDRRALR